MSAHTSSIRSYLAVFLALMTLTAATTAVAFVDLGVMNDVAAMTIAVAKALLVILYFMHVRHSSKLIWVFLGAGVLWLLILFVLMIADPRTRADYRGWEHPVSFEVPSESVAVE